MKSHMKRNREVSSTIQSYINNYQEYIEKTENIEKFPIVREWLDKFIQSLSGNLILDVGFGSGRDIKYFLDHNLTPEGLEIAEPFINYVKKCYQIPVFKMDMTRIKLQSNYYHGIWCCSSFAHIPDSKALSCIEGFRRILKNNGILYLSVKSGEGNELVRDEKANISTALRYFNYYTFEKITSLLKKSHFDIIETSYSESVRENGNQWINIICKKILNNV